MNRSPSLQAFSTGFQHRILIIDDQPMICYTLKKTLESVGEESAGEVYLNDDQSLTTSQSKYLVDCFPCAEDSLEMVRLAQNESIPFSVAFVDLDIPNRWRGTRAIQELWKISPELQVVLCSALTDATWKDVVEELGLTDQLLILKKPFDNSEVLQLACSLTKKWELAQQARWNQEHLREIVDLRNRELLRVNEALTASNEELKIARDLAEAANEAKSRFLSTMSHEFQTPLTAIMGFAEILREQLPQPDSDPEQASHFLDTIYRNSKRVASLMNNVLMLVRLETDTPEITRSEVCMRNLLDELLRDFKDDAREKTLSLTAEVSQTVPAKVWLDKHHLREILGHLLSNAVKFTEQGEIVFQVSLSESGMLRVVIKDTGVGMPPELLDSLCQPFTQLDTSWSRSYGGLGVGLSISRQLVELLNGSLTGNSEVGQGTRLLLEIPASLKAA